MGKKLFEFFFFFMAVSTYDKKNEFCQYINSKQICIMVENWKNRNQKLISSLEAFGETDIARYIALSI